jgi:hypothetical protein
LLPRKNDHLLSKRHCIEIYDLGERRTESDVRGPEAGAYSADPAKEKRKPNGNTRVHYTCRHLALESKRINLSTSLATSSPTSPTVPTALGKADVSSIAHISRVQGSSRHLGHEVAGDVLEMGLLPCWVERRIVAEVGEIQRIGSKVRLSYM